MKESLYLAIKYIMHNRIKSLAMILSITLIITLPLCLNYLVNNSEKYLMNRAEKTPLLVGKIGSSLDLVINSLYFEKTDVPQINYSETQRVINTGFAVPVPLHTGFFSNNYPIVGTTPEYLEFRALKINDGETFTILGDCVIGYEVAKKLGLGPGDKIISSPETALDLAGVYPLQMNITGVLEKSFSPDDSAVFIDIKTAWIIEGIIHGHKDIESSKDSTVLLGVKDKNYIANAKLYNYNTITPENISEFHLHGDYGEYPITSIIALPNSEKDKALLMGRFIGQDEKLEILVPKDEISKLLENIFKFKQFFNLMFVIVAISLVVLLVVVFILSLRLRSKEIETMYKLGSSRFKILELIVLEITFLLLISLFLSGLLTLFALNNLESFIKLFIT